MINQTQRSKLFFGQVYIKVVGWPLLAGGGSTENGLLLLCVLLQSGFVPEGMAEEIYHLFIYLVIHPSIHERQELYMEVVNLLMCIPTVTIHLFQLVSIIFKITNIHLVCILH